MRRWLCRGHELHLEEKVVVMGILNVTPDSFSDGGRWTDASIAVKHAISMAADGADIIDVGGESTRPGAAPVTSDEELDRVLPVIEALEAELEVPISVDTSKASVARAALGAGASIVNDVTAFRGDEDMASVCSALDAGVVLMHMLGEPRTMQQDPTYDDVVSDVGDFLNERRTAAIAAGIDRERIVVDPGIGFGKTLDHNLQLLRALPRLEKTAGAPVLLGPSRKSFIGAALDLGVTERLEGTAAVVALAVASGVRILRVHDVKEMTRVIRMAEAVLG